MTPPKKTRGATCETATGESVSPPERIETKFPANPDEAIKQLLDKLFKLIMDDGNTTAAKILLDVLDRRFDDAHPAFSVEDALKLLRDRISDAAK